MKKVFCVLLCAIPLILSAQNYRHTAFDTNGPMGECLFPMDEDGEIIFSEIVELDSTKANVIKDAIKSYIDKYTTEKGVDKKEKIEEWSLDYEFEHPVGKQELAFEIYFTQMFSIHRDASKVKFKMNIQVREGKFKYKLYDFWTSRRMIHGEGKNNGPSNMIHWQRVNSLTKERNQFARKNDSRKRSVVEELYDKDAQIQSEKELYVLEHATIMNFIDGLKSLTPNHKVSEFDDFEDDIKPKQLNKRQINVLDVSSFSDRELIERGRYVYVTSISPAAYVKAGVYELQKQISIDGIWKVVSYPEQAHFIIEYRVDTVGKDKAYVVIKRRDGKILYTSKKYGSGESASDNYAAAKKIYNTELYPSVTARGKNKVLF